MKHEADRYRFCFDSKLTERLELLFWQNRERWRWFAHWYCRLMEWARAEPLFELDEEVIGKSESEVLRSNNILHGSVSSHGDWPKRTRLSVIGFRGIIKTWLTPSAMNLRLGEKYVSGEEHTTLTGRSAHTTSKGESVRYIWCEGYIMLLLPIPYWFVHS